MNATVFKDTYPPGAQAVYRPYSNAQARTLECKQRPRQKKCCSIDKQNTCNLDKIKLPCPVHSKNNPKGSSKESSKVRAAAQQPYTRTHRLPLKHLQHLMTQVKDVKV